MSSLYFFGIYGDLTGVIDFLLLFNGIYIGLGLGDDIITVSILFG